MKRISHLLSLVVVLFIGLVLISPATYAIERSSTDSANSSTPPSETEEKKRAREEKIQEKQQQVLQKKEEAKKKVCQKREKNITNTMSRISEREEKILEKINQISEKTQSYYKNKQLSVSNYDELLLAIEEKKTAAISAVENVKSAASFSCDSTAPKQSVETFRSHRQDAVKALKEYRDAVKNLVQTVRSASTPTTEENAS